MYNSGQELQLSKQSIAQKDLDMITFTDNLQWSERYSYKIIAGKA